MLVTTTTTNNWRWRRIQMIICPIIIMVYFSSHGLSIIITSRTLSVRSDSYKFILKFVTFLKNWNSFLKTLFVPLHLGSVDDENNDHYFDHNFFNNRLNHPYHSSFSLQNVPSRITFTLLFILLILIRWPTQKLERRQKPSS